MSDGQSTSSRLAVLMFTDVVGSSQLKSRLGTPAYAALISRHDRLFRKLLAAFPSAELLQDTGDGYFAAFRTVSDAVRFALRFQDAMHCESWGAEPLRTRVGIHLGELAQIAGEHNGPAKIVGIAADVAARLMSLARGGQILLTRAAFDEARQFVSEYPCVNGDPSDAREAPPLAAGAPPTPRRALRWMAHGDYVFHGTSEPVEVFEVGGDGIAPLAPPRDREKARRSTVDGKDEILGWRPAIGLVVPQTPAWVLERKLGEGTFGEVWLARHQKMKQNRVFKFCFDAERLESFKRELTLFRLLRDALGERPDIARLYDVCLDRPPYFLESEYAPAGSLTDWAAAQGGLHHVPLATRLEIVAQVCDAVAAAHSVGVLHKDIKPSNILVHVAADGSPRPQLTDFGIGMLTDKGQLAARNITEVGFTMMGGSRESSRTGTRIYAPPESLAGRPFTTQGDIYALGVLLYQMTIGDLERPLALGWERGVDDALLREDIAACVDGDPERRINSAAEIASRLRRLPERREQRSAKARQRETSRRRHRLLRAAAVVAAVFCVLSSLAVIGFFRERRLRVEAQTAYAAGAVDQGVALHLAGRGQPSREAFIRARDAYARLGNSTLAADVGLYRSFREFDAPINTISGHADGVMAVVWLADGARIASVGDDGIVHLWDARTGRQLGALDKHVGLVAGLAASPDGRRLLSGGKDRHIRLWNVERGTEIRSFSDPTAEVRGVAFSPDGRRALSGSYGPSSAVRLWDLETGAEIRSFVAPGSPPYYGVAFSPDGRRALATTYLNDLWVWDLAAGDDQKPLHLAGHTGYVISAAFSPDGRRILSASFDKTLRVWDAATGKPIGGALKGHAAGVRGAAFLGSDAAQALSCSMDGTLKLWDLASGQVLRTFAGHTEGVRGVAVSPDGLRAVSGGIDRALRVWDLRPNNEAPAVDEGATVTVLSHTPNGMALVCGNESGSVTLRDLPGLQPLMTFAGHDRPIECATVLKDGTRLFTADDTGDARLWEIATGRELRRFPRPLTSGGAAGRIRGDGWRHTAVAVDGSFAVSSTPDRLHVEVWSLDESATTLGTIGPHENHVTCLAVSPDGKQLLCGDRDGDMYQWDLSTRQLLFKTPDRTKSGTLDCVAFSADGRRALAGGHDLVVRLWDLASRKEERAFQGHTLVVRTVGFGRDGGSTHSASRAGATIFSAGSDHTLRMFEAATGRELDLAAHFALPVYASVVISPGDAIAVASGSTISLWDLSRASRHVEEAPRLDAARAAPAKDPDDAAALLTLGKWYAFRGVDDWAVELLERARAAGGGDANVPSLTLARCYRVLNRPADAAREYRRAIERNEAPAAYVNLCLAALEQGPTAASQPTTAPSAQAN